MPSRHPPADSLSVALRPLGKHRRALVRALVRTGDWPSALRACGRSTDPLATARVVGSAWVRDALQRIVPLVAVTDPAKARGLMRPLAEAALMEALGTRGDSSRAARLAAAREVLSPLPPSPVMLPPRDVGGSALGVEARAGLPDPYRAAREASRERRRVARGAGGNGGADA